MPEEMGEKGVIIYRETGNEYSVAETIGTIVKL